MRATPLLAALAALSVAGCMEVPFLQAPAGEAAVEEPPPPARPARRVDDPPPEAGGPALEVVELPLPLPGQLKPLPLAPADGAPPGAEGEEGVSEANRAARVEPGADGYVNAIQVFPWSDGALYQVYTAPGQVTDLALGPGESLVSLSAGDTVRWKVGETASGSGEGRRVHVLVKPVAPGLRTNLVIATDRRVYHVELTSTEGTYIASASWTYPSDGLVLLEPGAADARRAPPERPVAAGLRPERLRFGYRITGDSPEWRPLRAFDDGRSVYIQFPADADEAPPLFVAGPEGGAELVNYRVRGSYYVVDRLFRAAELRLGGRRQAVVRIERER